MAGTTRRFLLNLSTGEAPTRQRSYCESAVGLLHILGGRQQAHGGDALPQRLAGVVGQAILFAHYGLQRRPHCVRADSLDDQWHQLLRFALPAFPVHTSYVSYLTGEPTTVQLCWENSLHVRGHEAHRRRLGA